MNRSTYASLSHVSLHAQLAGTDSRGRLREVKPGFEALIADFARLHIEQPGAIERVDQLLRQIEGVQQGARRLRNALVREQRHGDVAPEVDLS